MKLAIFGGGSIGQRHARNAKALGHDVMVFDTNPARGYPPMCFLASAYDAVLICTPASTHEAIAEQLLHDGYTKSLFVEKPIALSSHAPIFSEWPHPVTMVGYNWRFHPEIAPLQVLAQRGGTLHLDCRTDMRRWPGAGYGDPLLECSHEIDLACHWLGDPTSVYGGTLDAGTGAWLQMVHSKGDSVIDVRWRTEASRQLTLHLPGLMSVHARLDSPRHDAIGWPEAPALTESYVLELQHFLAAVATGQPTACPFSQGLRVVEICEQVTRTAA